MKDLIKKYRFDSLSRTELKKAVRLDDGQLDRAIYDDWCDSAGELNDFGAIPSGSRSRIKRRIDSGLGLDRSWWPATWRAVRIAAVILLPLFIAATVVLYLQRAVVLPESVEVATALGERSSVTLPDNSVVKLNGSSVLVCGQDGFRDDDRSVEFAGEAYFCITKDSEHPFVVNAHGFKVTVLGTKFNLDAHPDTDVATLYLEEGLVRLTSDITGESIEVHPKEKAVMNYADGHIAVYNVGPDDNTLAWLNGKLVFRDEPLGNVLDLMQKYYGYVLSVNDANLLNASFTGTIPADDMNVAVAVLEKAFDVKFTLTRISR